MKTLVDEDVYEESQKLRYLWRANPRSTGHIEKVYAVGDCGGTARDTYLHRWIMKAPANKHVDHVNGDTLDNRRENLRLVSPSQNLLNRKQSEFTPCTNTGYLGVNKVKEGQYRAYACGKHLGVWPTAELAACARDYKVLGVYANSNTNWPIGEQPHSYEEVEKTQCRSPESKTGYPNIRFKDGAYEAYTRIDGKRKYLGRFETLELAREAQIQVGQ